MQAPESIHDHFEDTHSLLEKAEVQICTSVILPCKIICTSNKTEIDKLISGTYCAEHDSVPRMQEL